MSDTTQHIEQLDAPEMGRPTIYSAEIAYSICAQLAEGNPLTKICKDESMPGLTTVYRWLIEKPDFRDIYARSREDQADTLADEIIEISDGAEIGADVQRDRLRVDTRKWIAAKLKPRKYSDRIQQEVSGADGAPLRVMVYVPDNGRGSN